MSKLAYNLFRRAGWCFLFAIGMLISFQSAIAEAHFQDWTPVSCTASCARIWDMEWSADETQLAVASTNGIQIYASDGELMAVPTVDSTDEVTWSPDGRFLASRYVAEPVGDSPIADYAVLRIWDFETDTLFAEETIPSTRFGLSWRPVDGENILTYSDEDSIHFWNMETGEKTPLENLPDEEPTGMTLPEYGYIWDMMWSRDGERLAIATSANRLYIWNATTQSVERTFWVDNPGDIFEWHPDGQRLVLVSLLSDLIHIFDVETGETTLDLDPDREIGYAMIARWSPNGEWLATAHVLDLGRVRIWDAPTWEVVDFVDEFDFTPHRSLIRALAWSPDGDLAVGDDDGRIYIWHREE